MSSIAQALAEYTVKLTYEELPDDVADMAKKCVFDGLGNLICGRYSAMGEKILKYIQCYSRSTGGEGTVSLLGGGKVSREDGMTAHAVMVRCSDLDDGHRYAMGHPGSVIIPAVLSAGEIQRKSTREMLTAVTAGYDVYCRIGAAVNPTSYRERGFDATGICGAPACAAALGKLYDLDGEQMKNALGIAASFAGGLIEYQNDGTMGKVLCGCWAVQNAVQAVFMAKQGFTGPEKVFEGAKGFLQAFSNAPNPMGVLGRLGSDFKIKETYFKMHACMRGLHAAVDALLDIRRREGLTAADIAEIEVRTTPFVGRLSKPDPDTLIGAQCSVEFVLAAAMTYGHICREEVLEEALERADIRDLASRVCLVMDSQVDSYVKKNPSHWAAVNMVIHTADGRRFGQWMPLPRGEAESPFEWSKLRAKFGRLIAGTPYEPYEELLYQKISHFEKERNWESLFAPWELREG